MSIVSQTKEALSVINRVISDVILRRIDDRYIITTDSAIGITGIDREKNCIYLKPHQGFPLYGISLEKGGNLPRTIDYFERLVETYSNTNEDARLFCFYTKSAFLIDEIDDTFCTKQNLYIFSFSNMLIEEIADYFDIKLMEPEASLKALLDIGLNSQYYNTTDTLETRSRTENIEMPIDEMAFYFKSIFTEGVYNAISKSSVGKSFHVYQGVGHNGFMGKNRPNIIEVLRQDWRGYININFEFSVKRTSIALREQKKNVMFFEPDKEVRDSYKMMAEEHERNPSSYALANIVFVTDNKKCLQKVSDGLNINFFEKKIFAKDILYTTPILSRDGAYDFLMHTSFAKQYIQQTIRSANIRSSRIATSLGRDGTGSVTRFSVYESPAPHTGVAAKSRSGKTYFVLSLISGALRAKVSLDPNYVPDDRSVLENSPVIIEEAPRLGTEVDIVHFDVGYSGIKWINQLKKCYPEKVHINSDNLNYLRFGLTDVKTVEQDGIVSVDKTDALFLIKTISTLLELNGTAPLTIHESQVFIDKLAQLFAEKKYKSLVIKNLRSLGGYDEILAEVESVMGFEFDEYSSLTDYELPQKYNFLVAPLLSDVINLLETTAASMRISDEEGSIMHSAALKIRPLSEDKMFGYYNRSPIPNTSYFYMELESLKKMGDNILVPVYLMLFQQLYRLKLGAAQEAKNHNKTAKETFFIMEELHNFTKINELRGLLEAATLEAARYGIVFFFISQNADHFPDSILLNLGNRIIMPAQEEEREMQIGELPKFWKTEEVSGADEADKGIWFFKNYAKRFNAVIKNGNGLFTFMPHSTKEKIWLFNSDAVATTIE
jgi:hypothetical protein